MVDYGSDGSLVVHDCLKLEVDPKGYLEFVEMREHRVVIVPVDSPLQPFLFVAPAISAVNDDCKWEGFSSYFVAPIFPFVLAEALDRMKLYDLIHHSCDTLADA